MSITLDKRTNRWRVRKSLNGKRVHLGMYPTKEAAAAMNTTTIGDMNIIIDIECLTPEQQDYLTKVCYNKRWDKLSLAVSELVNRMMNQHPL